MKQNLYIAGAEAGSGKSIVALAMMDRLCTQGAAVGFFRPLAPATGDRDALSALVGARYGLETNTNLRFGCSSEMARSLIADDRYQDLLKHILAEFKKLESRCEHILCVGTDYSRAPSALEFDFNAELANHLGCVILPVVRGHGRDTESAVNATVAFQESLESRGCQILATVVNRVASHDAATIKARLDVVQSDHWHYVIPEEPSLGRPTVADIARALDARLMWGGGDELNHDVQGFKIAAMHLPEFLEHIAEADLVIVPTDRADIIAVSLLAYPSQTFPKIAGLLLTGDAPLPAQLCQLIEGLERPPVAGIAVAQDTFTVAMRASAVTACLTADNERKVAAALGLVERSMDMDDLAKRLETTRSTRVTPLMFEHDLVHRAKAQRQHIVLPEGAEPRILQAAEILSLRAVVDLTLLGNVDEVRAKAQNLGLQLEGIEILDPASAEQRDQYAATYYTLRKHKGISEQMAYDVMADVSYFGTMMVHFGHADGMVSGSAHTTQHTIRPAFEFIKTRPGAALVSSVFFMCLSDRVLVYGDCAVNPNPDAEQLADIAITSADTAATFGVDPRVAMLSYSTGESGKGEDVERVREATRIARERRPDLKIEGPLQYDAAVDASVAKTKLPGSEVAGRATVFIFPDLNTGNNTYKAVQRSAGAVAVGPVLQGLNKPVNDLSRGCTVTDIVNTVAITAIQAQTGRVR